MVETQAMVPSTHTIRIAQLSDTHFIESGEPSEGGFSYDTDAAFEAVRDHLEQFYGDEPADLVVVTGDIADHGRPAQYQKAAAAFASFRSPINVCPGNHDQDVAFAAGMGRPTIGTSRAVELGSWCFLFVDSNAGSMIADADGRLVDPERYDDRLEANGSLGAREASWVKDMCATTTAEHVFIWLHHPPAPPAPLSFDNAYLAEWAALLADLPKVRGLGGGHTHVPDEYVFQGRPVFVCPSLKNNFDMTANTMLPPGARTYEFRPDGTIASETQLVEDARWPRHPLGRAVMSLLNGELSWEQFDAIVARKRA